MRPNRKQFLVNPLFKRAYAAWQKAKQRCCDPRNNRFSLYGGRGIKICDQWVTSFDQFLLDMGLPPSSVHTIGRIDSDGNYEPKNCRWETKDEQAVNRRNNRIIEINGIRRNLAEWGRVSGLGMKLIWSRLSQGVKGASLLLPSKGYRYRPPIIDEGETITQISKKTGIDKGTLRFRYSKGMRGEALRAPLHQGKRVKRHAN